MFLFASIIAFFVLFHQLGPNLYILFAITAASVVPCGGPKKSLRASPVVQIIFSFRSFEFNKDFQSGQNNYLRLETYF